MIELNVNGDKLRGLVSDRQIEEAIESLTGDGESFAILARAEQVYIQTAGDPANGFVLEYRDGSEGEHYACANPELTAEQIVWAFQSYLADDDKWKTELEWQLHDFNYSREAGTGKKVVIVIGLRIAAAAAWKLFVAN